MVSAPLKFKIHFALHAESFNVALMKVMTRVASCQVNCTIGKVPAETRVPVNKCCVDENYCVSFSKVKMFVFYF